jgi:hypothetical protein
MKRLISPVLGILLLLAGAASVSAENTVVASTSWTGSIARAAGARSVHILAPLTLQHPPEYALKPSDLIAVRSASVVVYAGYERFAKKLVETAAGTDTRLIKIVTDNTPATVKAQALLIAKELGTIPEYNVWAKKFTTLTGGLRTKVLGAYGDRPVIVQKFMESFARWIGLNVVGDFGPADPSPSVVVRLAGRHPSVVIDNYHSPNGKAIAEAAGAHYVQLINFPGRDGTRSIEDVFRYDAELLLKALPK